MCRPGTLRRPRKAPSFPTSADVLRRVALLPGQPGRVRVVGTVSGISRERICVLGEREARRFVELRRRGNAWIESARARMPNGVPSSWMVSLYEHPPIVVETGEGGA